VPLRRFAPCPFGDMPSARRQGSGPSWNSRIGSQPNAGPLRAMSVTGFTPMADRPLFAMNRVHIALHGGSSYRLPPASFFVLKLFTRPRGSHGRRRSLARGTRQPRRCERACSRARLRLGSRASSGHASAPTSGAARRLVTGFQASCAVQCCAGAVDEQHAHVGIALFADSAEAALPTGG
jgi:hypothetical protein